MNELAQYFTKEPFSALLTSSIHFNNPKLVIDLGIGDGALTSAAQKRWKDASFFGVDVDSKRVASLTVTHSNVNLYNFNSLDRNLSRKINIKVGSVDIAICNPPYLTLEKSTEYSNLLISAGLLKSKNLLSYTTDLLFIAQNLSLLKHGGILGIILPAGLMCGHNFELFRQDLLENHSIENIIELQAKIFKKTEAKTFILIVKKGKNNNKTVLLSSADKTGLVVNKIEVAKQDLYHRMDYGFHSRKHQFPNVGKKLKDLVTSIQRGNMTNLELKNLNIPYFHTTDFKKHQVTLKANKNSYKELITNPIIASKGDILLGRVGKTCHNQILIIESGEIALTDCVYRIRSNEEYQKKIVSYLSSAKGIDNLNFIKHGVCAQVISKRDLEEMYLEI